MAVWQFNMKLIPQDKLEKKYNKIPDKIINDDDIEELTIWDNENISIEELANVLLPEKSWSEEIKQYGSLEKTCVEFLFGKSKLLEISIRLDLRELTKEILISIINFIEINNALILLEDGKIIRPFFDIIINEIKNSSAYSFVKNPKSFLQALSR